MALAPNHSHPGSLLTGCHSGSLSDHEKVRGHLAWKVVRASCLMSLESEFGGERPIANIGDVNGS